ncbi:MAG: hypothetical protein KBD39_11400 [Sterolibacterium sp.]|nr:hypothetical protein [Sterolibacterium sp.]MBP9800707.1 hypothetical protein [Sterolibacterium sp.]
MLSQRVLRHLAHLVWIWGLAMAGMVGLAGCSGGGGGASASTSSTTSTTTPVTPTTPAVTPSVPGVRVMRAGAETAGDWLTFTLNVQDFAYPERSAATVERVINLHEQYQLPVDIYLTDNTLATFETSYPELLNRLRNSAYVGLNYHIRPPKPYYTGYDWAGLSSQSQSDQLASVRNYESHVTDLVTGLPTTASGGFVRLKQLTGNNAVIAAFQADAALYPVVSQVFRELGANMGISHAAPYINLGTQSLGLNMRPEHYDLLLFQSPGQSAASLIEAGFVAAHGTAGAVSPFVVGVKMHDNDFFAQSSAWTTTYVNAPRRPPWSLSARSGLKTEAEMAAQWTLYEEALAWASANRSHVAVANGLGLNAAIAAAPSQPTLYVAGTMHIESSPKRWPNPDQLMAFFQRATAIGRVGSQANGMRWSIGADIGWLNGEKRAAEIVRTLSALGVEWDVHVHSPSDRAAAAQRIIALGGTPTTVLSGVQVSDIDSVRVAQSGSAGYSWQAVSMWGLVRTGSHSAGSEDLSAGLWQPRSSTDWQAHDPAASLVAVGGGSRALAEAETLAVQLVTSKGYTAPLYSTSIMVDSYTLTVSDAVNAGTSTDGIDAIETFASRMGARTNVRWASLSEIARAWRSAGSIPSRIVGTQ